MEKLVRTSPFVIFASIIIIIAGLMAAKEIVVPLLLALFISIICAQPVYWLIKKKVPYSLSIFIVLIGIMLILVILGSLVGQSLKQFSANLPAYQENLKAVSNAFIKQLEDSGRVIDMEQIREKLNIGKILSFTADAIGEIGNLMTNSFLILLITIFMLAETTSFSLKAEMLAKTHNRSLDYLYNIGRSIRHYLSLKTVVSLITGVFITLWLMVVGVDYAILWGIIAFLLNYIPNIGSIIAAVPTMLLALVQLGVGGMIWTAVGYLLVNTVVGNVIEPRMMGKGLGLSTLVVFISLILWGYVFGTVGMFLSVPLTLTLKMILEENTNTRWIANLLGSDKDLKKIMDNAE